MSIRTRNDDESEVREEEEDEVLKLEEEVERMAEKVLDCRTSLPYQLTSTLASLLSSQRPIVPELEVGTDTGSDSEVGVGQENFPLYAGVARPGESGSVTLLIREDRGQEEKIQLLKQKMSTNASKMQTVMQRMKEYMARIDKLESPNDVIHPAFKRKRTILN
ncbi:uncharacterized protein LOC142505318 isoform X1 [Primulina tabacum]|uniref:uncharacterized protein LOC142505318 isoform X1 n=1 Tax=Primulina tabacum TaxID=48773 RepID=UPI003F59487F